MTVTDEPARSRAAGDVPPPDAVTPSRRITAVTATLAGALAALVISTLLDPTWFSTRVTPDAMMVAVLLPALAVAPRRAPLIVAGMVVAWLGLHGLLALAKDMDTAIPVDRAVGGGAYYNTPYLPAQAASLLALALVLLVFLALRLRRGAVAEPEADGARRAPGGPWLRRPALLVGIGTGLIALALLPDPWVRLSGADLADIPPSWDWANVLAWDWLNEHGFQPVQDFFYPYGHVILYNATPWGPMWQWFAHTFLLAAAAWGFWRLSGRSVWRTLLAVAVFAITLRGWVVLDRYIGGFVMGIVYAALGPGRHRRPGFGHLLLALVTLYTTWLEPDVLLIGVAAIILVALGELIAGRLRLRPRELARRALVDAAPLAVVALVPLIWAVEGTFEENTRFWLAAGATGTASAVNQDFLGKLATQTVRPTYAMMTVGLPVLLLIAGLVLGRVRSREAHSASKLFLIAAAACQVMLLKDLVRDTAVYVMVFAVTLTVPAVIMLWNRRNVRLAAGIGVFAGLALVAVQQERLVSIYVEQAVAAPGHALDSLRVPGRYAEVRRAEEQRFSGERFHSWPDVQIARELQVLWKGTPQRFAVVGDSPLVYVLLGQKPPYHVQLYDAARIEEQRVYVDAIKRENPAHLVFRRDFSQDGLPIHVRSPLIVDYMIRNYVPVKQGATWDILERRGDRRIAVEYWRKHLDTVVLGGVPGNSAADGAERCDGGDGCAPYAMLRGHTEKTLEPVLLRVTGPDGQAFGAVVNANPDDDVYPVRLDRLWFAPLVGPNPRVEVQQPAGWTVAVEGRRTGDDLY